MMARMKLGQIVATRGVVGLMRENNDFAAFVHRSFQRYLRADWGELCESDRKQNDRALAHDIIKNGSRAGNLSAIKRYVLRPLW